eukprot:5348486-Pyramimonas_sp.AAC.2
MRDPDAPVTFSLHQDAIKWATRGSVMCTHTLIKNMGIVFSNAHGRWLTWRELLMLQGFPIYPGAKVNLEPTVFDYSRSSVFFPDRKRNQVLGQVGNTMNLNVIGAGMLWLMTNVLYDPYFADPGSRFNCPAASGNRRSLKRKIEDVGVD